MDVKIEFLVSNHEFRRVLLGDPGQPLDPFLAIVPSTRSNKNQKGVEMGTANRTTQTVPYRSETIRKLLHELDHLGSTSWTDSTYHVASLRRFLFRHAIIGDCLLLLALDTKHLYHQHAPPFNTFGVYPNPSP